MCLILIAHQLTEQMPRLVLANRDEFYVRPTAAAAQWQETPGMVAGRDLVSGGTWFGACNDRWATVTNIREGVRDKDEHNSKSRGWLVRDYLQGDVPPAVFFANITATDDFAGFNLLLGDRQELWYASSHDLNARLLPPGIYGLSNHLLDTPWPKVVRGKEGLKKLLNRASFDHEAAFTLLADTTRAADVELPDTGVPLEWEQALSSIFVTRPNYGTLCSTILTSEADGHRRLVERRFTNGSQQREESAFSWEA